MSFYHEHTHTHYLYEEGGSGVDLDLVELFGTGVSGGGTREVGLHSNHPHRHLRVEHLGQPEEKGGGLCNVLVYEFLLVML